MRRTPFAVATIGVAAALLSVSPSTAAPAVPPADVTPYAGAGSAQLLDVQADIPVGDFDVADVGLSPVSSSVDTSTDPRSSASGANLVESLLDGNVPLDGILTQATQSAPPDNDAPAEDTLIEIPADPVVELGVSTSRASARWPGDGVCLTPGEPIASGYNETAGASVLNVPDTGAVVTLDNALGGVTATRSTITTEEVAGEIGRALVSTSETQVDAVTILEGTPLEVTVGVASTPTLTAVATGQPGGASVTYNDPIVTIDAPEGGALEPLEEVGTQLDVLIKDTLLGDVVTAIEEITGPLSDAGVLEVDVLVGDETLVEEVAADGTGAAGTVSVVRVDISVLDVGGTLLDVSVDLGPMAASAAVPAGGINCAGPPECSDGVDNDDPEDELVDEADPGCHTDGDPDNPDSYDPDDDSEIDQGQTQRDPEAAPDETATPGPLPKTGRDVPVPAVLALAGAGLAGLGLRRRLSSAS